MVSIYYLFLFNGTLIYVLLLAPRSVICQLCNENIKEKGDTTAPLDAINGKETDTMSMHLLDARQVCPRVALIYVHSVAQSMIDCKVNYNLIAPSVVLFVSPKKLCLAPHAAH